MPLTKTVTRLFLKKSGQTIFLAILLLCVFFGRAFAGLFPAAGAAEPALSYPVLTSEQRNWIGQQIFRNECNSQASCLTSWNPGEEFPSLGIGHFIWYQENQQEIFTESFPALLDFFQSRGIAIPAWIITQQYNSPWLNRDRFLADFDNPQLSELRILLASSIPEQTEFIIQRFESSLNKILDTTAVNDRARIRNRFYAVANSHPPYGMYALIDYVNFKGEGTALTERYAGQGWGLLQVLETMPETTAPAAPLDNFITAAKDILRTRVSNSPPQRNETRWLEGWFRRVDTYLPQAVQPSSSELPTP